MKAKPLLDVWDIVGWKQIASKTRERNLKLLYKQMIELAQDVSHAINFYQRYAGLPNLLKREQPKYYWLILEQHNRYFRGSVRENERYLAGKIDWDQAVFRLAFHDILTQIRKVK